MKIQKMKKQKEYTSLLNMTDDGVMGFIRIPSIDVSLPIYHGTSEETLEKGCWAPTGNITPNWRSRNAFCYHWTHRA